MAIETEVLWVDDDRDFLDMGSLLLERAVPTLSIETETDPQRVLNRLKLGSFDCLVSDYEMPKMDGLELLAAVRDDLPDFPVILFTGKGSEAIASRAVSLDVTGYQRKEPGTEQFELLAHAIERSVQGRRAKTLARRNERKLLRYKQAIECSSSLFAALDRDRTYLFVNETFLSYRTLSRSDVEGASIDDVLDRRIVDRIDPYLQAVFAGDKEQFILENAFPGIGERVFDVRYDPLTTPTGTIEGVVAEMRDITDIYGAGLIDDVAIN